MSNSCFECGEFIDTDVLKDDRICIRCYLDSPMIGEAYRQTDNPTSELMSVDFGDIFQSRVEDYWAKRNINSVDEAINNLVSYFDGVETSPLLAKLILHLEVSRLVFLDQGNDAGLGPQMVEYLLGVAACQSPAGTEVQYYDLLREASAVSDSISVANKTQQRPEKASAARKLAAREVALGRIASPGQYIEAAKRLYRPHSRRMKSEFGFCIDDAIEIVTAIRDEADTRHSNLYDEIPEIADQLAILDRIVMHRSKIPEIANEYESDIELVNTWGTELASNLYWVSPSRIKKRTSLPDDQAQTILDFLSLTLGDAEGYADPSDHNPLHETPLLEYQNQYLLPPKGLLEYVTATTFKYDLRSGDYEDKFNDIMGNVVEQWTKDILTEHLERPAIVTNVEYSYEGIEYESDVVVISNDTVAVFECKSKGLTLPTRKGHRGGVADIEQDVEKGLGKAYSQAHRLIDAIETGAVTELSGKSKAIDVSHCTEFQPCAIVSEAYDSLITTEYPTFIDNKKHPLYAASVFDLESVAARLSTPVQFLKYLTWKSTLVTNNDVYAPDEDDLLQAFLDDMEQIFNSEQTANLAGIGRRYKRDLYEYDSEYSCE